MTNEAWKTVKQLKADIKDLPDDMLIFSWRSLSLEEIKFMIKDKINNLDEKLDNNQHDNDKYDYWCGEHYAYIECFELLKRFK